ncbi:MAG: oxidoreductase [Candidatus Hydrogenedentota bacterium]
MSFPRRSFLAMGGATFLGLTASSLSSVADTPAWTPSSDRKVRMGVVGGRFGCSFHWHQHPNCEVAAVSDLIPERRDRLMQTYQCDKTYESLEKLILDPDIEAVALFTGAPDHPRHTVACMEAGKHVISACPACLTLDEAAEIKEVKERTGLRYMSAETSFYRWETITARRLYEDGLFGDLIYTEAEYYHPMNDAERETLWFFNGERTWRYGFAPMLYPTHCTAFLVGVTKERLTKVSSIGWGDNHPALSDNAYGNPFWNEMGMFETTSGRPFRCNVGWHIHAHGERAQWFGTEGALYMPNSGGQPFALRLPGGGEEALPDYWHMVPEAMRYDSGHGRSHPFITNEFIMALVEDREPAIDLYESLAYCVPGIIAHESSKRGGEQLAIPQFDPGV